MASVYYTKESCVTTMATSQNSSDSEGDDEDDDDDDDPRFVIELTNGSRKIVSVNRLEPYFELTAVSQTNQEFNVGTERQEVSHTLQKSQPDFRQAEYYSYQDFAELSLTLVFPFIEEHIFPYVVPSGKALCSSF
ncbi:unnamed protein product [Clavelina lepadiformis]|uniref:Uncharacterized protein n=1 Tax=Clavelina lepadiformis TaxID=159417 RepID=A0ABP0EYG6_CLALP